MSASQNPLGAYSLWAHILSLEYLHALGNGQPKEGSLEIIPSLKYWHEPNALWN